MTPSNLLVNLNLDLIQVFSLSLNRADVGVLLSVDLRVGIRLSHLAYMFIQENNFNHLELMPSKYQNSLSNYSRIVTQRTYIGTKPAPVSS